MIIYRALSGCQNRDQFCQLGFGQPGPPLELGASQNVYHLLYLSDIKSMQDSDSLESVAKAQIKITNLSTIYCYKLDKEWKYQGVCSGKREFSGAVPKSCGRVDWEICRG